MEQIRLYWEGRGAVFMHCDPSGRGSGSDLDRTVALADVVLHPVDGLNPEARRRLEACCERVEKPLLSLDELPLGLSGREADGTA